MSKKTITAAIYGGNGKQEHGVVANFRLDGGEVVVDFNGPKTVQTVKFKKLNFPNWKAQTAADALRSDVIAEFCSAD